MATYIILFVVNSQYSLIQSLFFEHAVITVSYAKFIVLTCVLMTGEVHF